MIAPSTASAPLVRACGRSRSHCRPGDHDGIESLPPSVSWRRLVARLDPDVAVLRVDDRARIDTSASRGHDDHVRRGRRPAAARAVATAVPVAVGPRRRERQLAARAGDERDEPDDRSGRRSTGAATGAIRRREPVRVARAGAARGGRGARVMRRPRRRRGHRPDGRPARDRGSPAPPGGRPRRGVADLELERLEAAERAAHEPGDDVDAVALWTTSSASSAPAERDAVEHVQVAARG